MMRARLTKLRIAVGTGVVLALVAVTTAGAVDAGRFHTKPMQLMVGTDQRRPPTGSPP